MKYFIANWKMYLNRAAALELASVARAARVGDDTAVVVCPSFVHVDAVSAFLRQEGEGRVALGAQDAFYEPSGAYTGAVNADQLKELGVSYVVVGHSERRRYFGETDEIVNKKARAVVNAGLKPVICVGETKDEHSAGKAFERVAAQVREALEGVVAKELLIAYEPVWAIGTGATPAVEDVAAIHRLIKDIAQKEFHAQASVLYGGSVTPENVRTFWDAQDIDGVLVGGASARKDQLSSLFALVGPSSNAIS